MAKLPKGWTISVREWDTNHTAWRWQVLLWNHGYVMMVTDGRTEAEARRKLSRLCERIAAAAVKGGG